MTRTMTFLKSVVLVTMLASVAYAAGDEDVFGLQPEIHHVFREAEKMPPVTFSYLFTVIALSPWLLLVGGVSMVLIGFKMTTNNESSSSGFNLDIHLAKLYPNLLQAIHFEQYISPVF